MILYPYILRILLVAVIIFFFLFGSLMVSYYAIRYGTPGSGSKKWESQKAYRDFYSGVILIIEGLIIIPFFFMTNFLGNGNISTLTVVIFLALSYTVVPFTGLFFGEYMRSRKFHIDFMSAIMKGPPR